MGILQVDVAGREDPLWADRNRTLPSALTRAETNNARTETTDAKCVAMFAHLDVRILQDEPAIPACRGEKTSIISTFRRLHEAFANTETIYEFTLVFAFVFSVCFC